MITLNTLEVINNRVSEIEAKLNEYLIERNTPEIDTTKLPRDVAKALAGSKKYRLRTLLEEINKLQKSLHKFIEIST